MQDTHIGEGRRYLYLKPIGIITYLILLDVELHYIPYLKPSKTHTHTDKDRSRLFV